MRSLLLAVALLGSAGCAAHLPPVPAGDLFPPPEALPGRLEVVGRGPVTTTHTSDVWVFTGRDGRDYAYTGTWGACRGCYGDRVYVWDVTDPASPVLTDSVVVDARVVNDVFVNAEATVAALTREAASSRRNGVVFLDLADPAHPRVASEYWETLTGGVHNTFIDGHHVYATHNGTGDLHVLDISDLSRPREVGRWGVPIHQGKYLHDVWVDDGLAYLSYWDDGLVILDVGNGIRDGSPQRPELVSQVRYSQSWRGRRYGNTHAAFPYTNSAGNRYIFVSDEIIPDDARHEVGFVPGGFVRVFDASDITRPVEVARYEVRGAGAHNMWAADDRLYVAYYNAGLRVVDVSGELQGDLRAAREVAALSTHDGQAFRDRPFTWGVMLHRGLIYVSDMNSGLWIARLVEGGAGGG
jgi:hypothetical protein